MKGSARGPAALRNALVAMASLLVLGCPSPSQTGDGLEPVTSGTVSGIAFAVIDGTLYQAESDGEIFADSSGATIVLVDDTAGLGMTDPLNLRMDWEFRLADGGSIEARAYGTTADLLAGALRFEVSRSGSAFDYSFGLTVEPAVTGTFTPAPSSPDGTSFIVTEFYGVDAPGYGASSSGMTAWPLDDVTPAFNTDILSCPPAVQTATLTDQRVGFYLNDAALVSVTPVDTIIGPCE